MLIGNALRQNLERSLGLLDGYTGLEPSHNREATRGPVCPVLLDKVVGVLRHFGAERNIAVHVEDRISSFKFLGRDAHNREGMFVDHDLLAGDVRVAPKSLAPVGVSQNQNRVCAGSAPFGGKNQTPISRLNPKCGEIIAGDAADEAVVRVLVRNKAGERDAKCKYIAEGVTLVAQVFVVGIRKVMVSRNRRLLESEDSDLLGMGHRQRAKQESIDDAEEGGVDGHAECQGNDADEGEARVLR